MKIILISILIFSANAFGSQMSKSILPDGTIRFNLYVPSKKSKATNRTFEWDMGNVPLGNSSTAQLHWYTDSNVLTQTIHYVHIVGSPQITITSDGCTGADLHFGASCYINFKYTPTTKSVAKASLTVSWTNELPPAEEGGPNEFTSAVDTWLINGSSFDKPPECAEKASGSIIDVAAQTLGEKVVLVGVPFYLSYSSQFSPDYQSTISAFSPLFGFNLENWTLSINHLYSKDQHRLFLGSGSTSARDYFILSNGNLLVTSTGGDETFVFSSTGKHLETRTFLTGALKYSFEYDSSERLVKVSDVYGKFTQINRNSAGQITSIISPYGHTTNFTLNSAGYFTSVTNPANETHNFTYKAGTRLLETFTKPGGQVSTFTYDTTGKLTKDLGNGGNFWELIAQTGGVIKQSKLGRQDSFQNSYDTNGNFVSTQTTPYGHVISSTEYPDNSILTNYQFRQEETHNSDDARYGYAHKRFAWSKVSLNGRDTYSNVDQSVSYPEGVVRTPFNFLVLNNEFKKNDSVITESFDNTTKTKTVRTSHGVTTTTIYDKNEKPISVRLGADVATTFNYNSLGQLVFTSQGPKNQKSYGYNDKGLVSAITNGRSESTWFNYNSASRLTSVITNDGRTVQFGYDANGNMTSVTPPGKPSHNFEFDLMELPSKYLPPSLSGISNKDTFYSYNQDKQLTSVANPDGSTLTYNYNTTNGLLTSTAASNGLFGSTSFLYQANTNLVYQRSTTGSRQRYTYYGDIMQSEELVTANTASLRIGKITFDFDEYARINSRTIADRNDVHNYSTYINYNNDNKIVKYGEMALTYYPKNGRLSTTTIRTVADSYVYDQYGELKKYTATVSGKPIYSYDLARDTMGRIISKIETIQGATKKYEYKYDSVGRLLEERTDGISTASFEYDANGNRVNTKLNGTNFSSSFDDQDRMLNFGARIYTHDANGAVTETASGLGVQMSYTRDINGDAVYAMYSDNYNLMYYDVQRRLVQKRIGSNPNQWFVYDHQNRIAASFSSSGVVGNVYHYPTGSHSPDFLTVGWDSYRIIKDHLGSPRLVIKTYDGSVVQKLSYNVLGQVTESVNMTFQPFGFAGGYYDDITKSVRFGARDYDTETGRWLTKDPIGFAGGDTNLYGYVLNDPVNFIDPEGQAAVAPLILPIIVPIGYYLAELIKYYRDCAADPQLCKDQATIDQMKKAADQGYMTNPGMCEPPSGPKPAAPNPPGSWRPGKDKKV